jgi:hypothetical protein
MRDVRAETSERGCSDRSISRARHRWSKQSAIMARVASAVRAANSLGAKRRLQKGQSGIAQRMRTASNGTQLFLAEVEPGGLSRQLTATTG